MEDAFIRPPLSRQLKEAIESHGLPVYVIAKEAGVEQAALSRFLSDHAGKHSDVRLEKTVEKLATYFQMKFTKPGRQPIAQSGDVSVIVDQISRSTNSGRGGRGTQGKKARKTKAKPAQTVSDKTRRKRPTGNK
jgi:predicted transcriptional regulator